MKTRRLPTIVLVLWLIIGAFTVPFIAKLQEATTTEATAFLPKSAESTQLVEAQKVFADNADLELTIVFRRTDAHLTVDDRDRIESVRAELTRRYQQTNLDIPIVPSQDAKAAYINLKVPNVVGDDAQVAVVNSVRELVGDGTANFQTYVTGPGAFIADAEAVYSGIDTKLLGLTALVVALLLFITYRSPVLLLLPLIAVALGDGLASWLLYLLADHGVLTIDGQTAGILPVLVFGAGTDYALLLISRYRDELRIHDHAIDAMKSALRKAAPTMAISCVIVVCALLCLLLSDLNSNRALGPVGALSIALTLVATLTVLPALLVLFGRRAFWPFVPTVGSAAKHARIWSWLGNVLLKHRTTIAATAAGLLVVGSLGLLAFNGSLRQVDSFRGQPESVKGQAALELSFPAGTSEPLFLITDTREALEVRTALSNVDGIGPVAESNRTKPGPDPDCVADNNDESVCIDLNGRTEYAITVSAANGTEEEARTIDAVRAAAHSVASANAVVGGSSAETLDLQRAASHDRLVVMPVILGIIFLLFCVFLRAIVASAVLVLTVVLSFAFALGVSVLVFRYVFGFQAEDSGLPLLGFVFLIALGVDYNVFLAARIRELVREEGTETATISGLIATGGVITSAGAVLAATFAVLAVLPVVSITQIGFLVVFGVLIDTFVVRCLLVPALLMLLGRKAWWPSALGREEEKAPAHAGKRFR